MKSFCLALAVQINASQRERIDAGVRIHLIKSPRGSYIRTPDGKFFAVRQPSSTLENASKMPQMPPPTQPPPPPTLSNNPIDQFLYSNISLISKTQNAHSIS